MILDPYDSVFLFVCLFRWNECLVNIPIEILSVQNSSGNRSSVSSFQFSVMDVDLTLANGHSTTHWNRLTRIDRYVPISCWEVSSAKLLLLFSLFSKNVYLKGVFTTYSIFVFSRWISSHEEKKSSKFFIIHWPNSKHERQPALEMNVTHVEHIFQKKDTTELKCRFKCIQTNNVTRNLAWNEWPENAITNSEQVAFQMGCTYLNTHFDWSTNHQNWVMSHANFSLPIKHVKFANWLKNMRGILFNLLI